MVLFGYKEQLYSIPQLDAAERRDPHVEEDSKQGRHGNVLQDGFHQDGQAWSLKKKKIKAVIRTLF